MAKRQRGGARPGQRAPIQRSSQPAAKPATKPVPPRPATTLSDDELARAAELEAAIVAEERAATSSVTRGRDRRRTGVDAVPAGRSRTVGGLTAVAENEYLYVKRDLRRIAVVFSGIFGLLLLSWIVIVGLAVVKI
jgi:hypothetical protein